MAEEKPTPKPKKAKKAALSVVEKTTFDQLLERINEEYAVVLRGSQVFIMRHWLGDDGKSRIIFLTKRDFLIFQENNKLWTADAEGNKEAIRIAPAWLQWTHRKTYEEVYFEPNGRGSEKRYNLWQGFPFSPKEHGKFDLILAHILNNICQGEQSVYMWIMAWLADLFQNPAQKPGTAIVLRGGKGVGKGVFAHTIGKLLGIHYMSITQSSQLTGKFNGHMMDKILMFVDESWWNDERKDAGVLNGLITESRVSVEMKGKDAIYIDNYTRFIIAANFERIVAASLDERRMAILDVGSSAQQNREYFAAIDTQMKDGGYEAFLYYLLNYKYDKTLPRTIPHTAALADHKLHSMTEEMKWWHECLILGRVGEFKLTNNNPPDNDIECSKFFEQYIKYCERMKVKPLAMNILAKNMKSFLELHKARKSLMMEREYFYLLKTLDSLRDDFDRALGDKYDWGDQMNMDGSM